MKPLSLPRSRLSSCINLRPIPLASQTLTTETTYRICSASLQHFIFSMFLFPFKTARCFARATLPRSTWSTLGSPFHRRSADREQSSQDFQTTTACGSTSSLSRVGDVPSNKSPQPRLVGTAISLRPSLLPAPPLSLSLPQKNPLLLPFPPQPTQANFQPRPDGLP